MSAGLAAANRQDLNTSITSRDFTAIGVDALVAYALKVGDPPPWPRMSAEVMIHSIEQHPCQGNTPPRMMECPCGDSLLLECGECDEPVMLFVHPDRPICSHTEPFLGDDAA